mgnify:CR=1 FL=1
MSLFRKFLRCLAQTEQAKGRKVSVTFETPEKAFLFYGKEPISFELDSAKTVTLRKKTELSICVFHIKTKGRNTYEVVIHKGKDFYQLSFNLWTYTTIVECYAIKMDGTDYSQIFLNSEEELLDRVKESFLEILKEEPAYRLWFVTNDITLKYS